MSLIILNVNEVRRTLSVSDASVFVVKDVNVDIVRFALNTGFTDVALDEYSALRVMYQRPGETEVRAQTLTYYDTDGLRNYYDWQLLTADLSEKGTLTVALCILRTDGDVEEWHTTPCQIRVLNTIHTDDSDEEDETITPTVAQRVAVLEAMIQRVASGAPIVVASTSAMTDTEQIYVLSTDGNWYYHNGSAWVAGGEYGAVSTDTTLTQANVPADAKAVGDEVEGLTAQIERTNKVLKTETGCALYEWEEGRIATNTTTIDITNVDTDTVAQWYHAVIPCVEGDVFHIKINNAESTSRPYAVVSASGTRLRVYNANAIDADITMPSSTAYLIVNSKNAKGIVCGGTSRISALETEVAKAYSPKGRLIDYPVDLNDIMDIGTYAIYVNEPSTRYSNCPFSDGGMLIVLKSYFNYRTQLAVSNDSKLFVRNYANGWRDWKQFDSLNDAYEELSEELSEELNAIAEDIKEQKLYGNLLGIFQTIGVVGDSLASGQGRINDLNHYHDFYEYSWPQQIGRILGNTVYNFTESSLSTRTWLTDNDHGWALASDGQYKCQAYIIGLGANDVALASADSSYIGSVSDIHVSDYTQNPDTYYGNYGRIISMLKTLEPRAKIFVVTNPAFGTESIRDQLNAAVSEIAELFDDVYLVSLDKTKYNSGFINANKVKSHYTPAAYLYMANILLAEISRIIYDNPADFFFVNLIGTEYSTPVMS